jgi:adenosylcobinamide-GDP ribazoletransferase
MSRPGADRSVLREAVAFFPLVGGLIGLATGAVIWSAALLWPTPLAVLLGLTFEALLTGALHEDAVADCCDALGARTREDMLRIMKDSRIGAYGTLGLTFAVLLRGACLSSLNRTTLLPIAIAAAAVGRWAGVIVMASVSPLADREGLARDVGERIGRWQVLAATALTLPAIAWYAWLDPVRIGCGIIAVLLGTAAWSWYIRRRLGGTTGDCIGFACYLAQIFFLLAAAARPGEEELFKAPARERGLSKTMDLLKARLDTKPASCREVRFGAHIRSDRPRADGADCTLYAGEKRRASEKCGRRKRPRRPSSGKSIVEPPDDSRRKDSPMPSPVSLRLRLALGVLVLVLTGPAFSGSALVAAQSPPVIVFVCDGAAGLPGPSTGLVQVAGCPCTSMRVEVVAWSHGTGRALSDLHGRCRHRARADELACRVQVERAACPQARICLVGHSTGASIVLLAAAQLPAGYVDRIVLLAPALSSTYDLCPALRASREGIDSFHSHRDALCLSLSVAGTADGHFFCPVAGWCGFKADCSDCETAALYTKLRQYANCHRGHLACVPCAFVRDHVVPLLLACCAPAE